MLVTLSQPEDLKRSPFLALQAREILYGVVRANVRWMKRQRRLGKAVPHPYRAGIRYQEEPDNGVEQFDDYPTVLRRGWGDCDDLAAALCAWNFVYRGIPCSLRITWRRVASGRRIFHVLVRYPDGRVEDPSLALGMRSADGPGRVVTRPPRSAISGAITPDVLGDLNLRL